MIRYDRSVLQSLERPERTLASGRAPARARARRSASARRPRSPRRRQRRANVRRTPAQPVEESLSERRAVRGVSVDDVGSSETPELREIRRFEELAFPRAAAGRPAAAGGDAQPAALSGQLGRQRRRACRFARDGDRARAAATARRRPIRTGCAASSCRTSRCAGIRPSCVTSTTSRTTPRGGRSWATGCAAPVATATCSRRSLARNGLPRDLVYLAMIESGFENAARSRVGAGGIWQFMPGAARAYGLEVSYWMDARRDPERSAEAAARYLKDLYVRFGSWPLVFAAYNAGYGAVLRVDHQLQHQRLLGAGETRVGAAVGIEHLRSQDHRGGDHRPQSGRVRVRRRHARAGVRLRRGDRARGDGAGVGRARGGREAGGHRGAEPAAAAGPDAARPWRDARARPCGVGGGVRGGAGQVARRLREAGHRRAAPGRDARRRRAHARGRGARAPAHQRRQGVDRAARGRGDPGAQADRARQGQGRRQGQRQGRRPPTATRRSWSRSPSVRSATKGASASFIKHARGRRADRDRRRVRRQERGAVGVE